jgi:hypothetical protein
MKKKIYIHIGRPKVGSTAIQRFLKFNRKTLLENDVLFPVTGERQSASHQLAAVLLEDAKPEKASSAETLYQELIDEIQTSSASNCIISSENFYFVKPLRLAKILADQLDVKIVCYVRRQDEVLVSSYIQEMRDNTLSERERDDLDRYLSRPDRLRFLDYKIVLDQWADVFGVENVVVRVYETGQLKGDLFDDVLDAMGVRSTQDYSKPQKRVNSTPASDILDIIKQVNHYPAPVLVQRQIKDRLVEISESMEYSRRFDATRIFTTKQKQEVLARFDKSNAATARKYLQRKDGRLFLQGVQADDVASAEEGGVDQGKDFDRMTQIWLGMISYQQQEFNKLEMQISILRKSISSKK